MAHPNEWVCHSQAKDKSFIYFTERIQKTVDLEKKELEIEERGVKLKLTIVDTPGFNDAVNAEER